MNHIGALILNKSSLKITSKDKEMQEVNLEDMALKCLGAINNTPIVLYQDKFGFCKILKSDYSIIP